MSPYHLPRPLGLVAASLLGLGAPILAALAPAAQDAPPDAAPITTAPAPAGERTSVLLLTNGQLRIHRGELIEEGPNYLLKARAGAVRIPKRTVEQVFGSMHELYLHKKTRLPQGDPDEHMKLAQWCLGQSMTAEAQEQLDAVLALSPGDRRAQAMVQNLLAKQERDSSNTLARDEGIRRAAAETPATGDMPAAADPNAPGELDDSIIRQIRAASRRAPRTKPVVFDLPDALAVKRYQEFGRSVHPLLQQHCANCHDENSKLRFQLIRTRTPRDFSNELLVRTNLDNTLMLIDRLEPNRSELLVKALMPHGNSPKAVLTGPNSPAYLAFSAWVKSLQATDVKPTAAQAEMTPATAGNRANASPRPAPQPAQGGSFGSRRGTAAPQGTGSPAPAPAEDEPYPVDKQVYSGDFQHPGVPADAKFNTVSPLVGGPNSARIASPKLPSPRQATPGGVVEGDLPPLQPATDEPTGDEPVAKPAGKAKAEGTVQELADGSAIVTQADGTQILRLADGTEVPLHTKQTDKGRAGAKKAKSDDPKSKMLEKFILQQRNAPPR